MQPADGFAAAGETAAAAAASPQVSTRTAPNAAPLLAGLSRLISALAPHVNAAQLVQHRLLNLEDLHQARRSSSGEAGHLFRTCRLLGRTLTPPRCSPTQTATLAAAMEPSAGATPLAQSLVALLFAALTPPQPASFPHLPPHLAFHFSPAPAAPPPPPSAPAFPPLSLAAVGQPTVPLGANRACVAARAPRAARALAAARVSADGEPLAAPADAHFLPIGSRAEGARAKPARLRWTPPLKALFNEAVAKLGGLSAAQPSAILFEMKRALAAKKEPLEGATRADMACVQLVHLKSHLQKCRLIANVPSARAAAPAAAAPAGAVGMGDGLRTGIAGGDGDGLPQLMSVANSEEAKGPSSSGFLSSREEEEGGEEGLPRKKARLEEGKEEEPAAPEEPVVKQEAPPGFGE